MNRGALLRGPLAVALLGAGWLGATLLFGAIVAPAAFAVLPSRALAGALVGRVLPSLFFGGMLIGLAPLLLAWQPRVTWAKAAGLLASTCCAVAQFAVAGRIERLRASLGGPLDALAAADPRRAAFARLHLMSVALLGVAALCMMVVVADAVRTARSVTR